jgi:hypothetical protein
MPVISKNPQIEKLFSDYERLFNDLNVKEQGELFSEHFISAGPRGSIAVNKKEFLQMADKAAEFYKKAGQSSAQILGMDEMPISNEFVMVTVHWGCTFRKTGDKLVKFDVSYIVDKTGDEPKILMFIAHQDEEKAMKELGVVPPGQRTKM